MKNVFILLLLLTISNSAFAQVSKKQKMEAEEIMDANRQWAKSATPEMFFSFIRTDALVLAPDKEVLKGHEAIGGMLAEFQSVPGFKIIWEPQEAFVSTSGDLGYSVDRILVTFDGENGETIKLFEKGVTIWKKDDQGKWKMAVDVWNVDKTINSIFK